MNYVRLAVAALPLLTGAVTGIALSSQTAHAQETSVAPQNNNKPFIHPLFTDHMVLQRDRKINVWGWTAPGSQVSVTVGKASTLATAGADGKWTAQIGPMPAGGPLNMVIAPGDVPAGATRPQTVVLRDVMFGDVWLCSGQSNMQWRLNWGISDQQQEIAAGNHPNIRYFTVPNVTAGAPQSTIKGDWKVVSPQTVGELTAVGYFFARELNQKLGVPIGLIDSSWGGTIAEAWVSEGSLRQMPDFVPQIEQVKQTFASQQGSGKTFDQQMADWWVQNDPGSGAQSWATADAGGADWKTMTLPNRWEDAGLPDFDGLVWLRREIDVPQAWAGKELTLNLGTIDDRDTTFWNGTQVGTTNEYNKARVYKIPGNLVTAGRNVIAVRVLDTGGGGGLYDKPETLNLTLDANTSLPLTGEWRYRVANPMAKLTPAPMKLEGNPNVTTVLYNAMIAPLVPYGIKGAIWYQGESNASRGQQYQTLLPTLITDWRRQFGQGNFPFYIVQLANFMAPDAEPRDDGWPRLREAQNIAAQRVPNAGVAVTIDIGDEKDIHPRNKQDVGKRLALLALAKDYGQKIEFSGPAYKSMTVAGNTIRLNFDHAQGLVAKGDKLTGFAIAGADKKFVWADARINGNSIEVSSPQVAAPVAVRYAWGNNPAANLYNGAGLPASPFRTDNW